MFGQSIQTNNNVEGYHRHLNGSAGGSHIPFYVFIPLLHKGAKYISVQMHLVKDDKLARYQRWAYHTQQGCIFDLWQRYEKHEITTEQLLKACSCLSEGGGHDFLKL